MEPGHEEARLRTLRAYRVLDTEPEAAFDTLAGLAASVCETPIALVALIDETRQWFKANVGLDGIVQTPRAWALSGPATRGHDVFEVRDARADARFAGNPLVVETESGADRIRIALGSASADVVVVPVALAAFTGVDRLPADVRGRVGLVAIGPAGERSGPAWDATVESPAHPAELRTAIYAAAANARLRRGRNPAGSGM